jgi:hypothetical protein
MPQQHQVRFDSSAVWSVEKIRAQLDALAIPKREERRASAANGRACRAVFHGEEGAKRRAKYHGKSDPATEPPQRGKNNNLFL